MRNALVSTLLVGLIPLATIAQTPQTPKPESTSAPADIIRISTSLVQTDVVVVNKNEEVVSDLNLGDFELYDNGKKQTVKFLEFISTNTKARSEGNRPETPTPPDTTEARNPSAKELKRVVAFVVDDLTLEIQDIATVRNALLSFVDNKMQPGDLVAVIRVIGGKGLLQQFTSDKQILRRAIAAIGPVAHPFAASTIPDPEKLANPLAQSVLSGSTTDSQPVTPEIYGPNDELNRYFRGLSALTTANFVISSLKEIPGHKNIVIISGGIPIFETNASGSYYTDITSLLNQLSDNALRAGVVINTLDPRGLRATPGVVGFNQTPARSALGGGGDPAFGRGSSRDQAVFGPLLAGGSEHLGLSTIAAYTGGVSIANTNDFDAGLDKITARSNGYYRLAYTPTEPFDNKFHKLEVKVKRGGARVYSHARYLAREDKLAGAPRTREEEIAAVARSPLARNELDVTPYVTVKFQENKASVGLDVVIDTKNLHFKQTADGKFQTSLDVVGFVFDQLGKLADGFSETIKLNLSPQEYQRILAEGLTRSASFALSPGAYQIRAVVREEDSGSLGTFSKYLELPDLTKGQLVLGSIFLFAVDASSSDKPVPLGGPRRISRKQELRYAATIYNPKLKSGKPQLHSEVTISYAGKVLFQEPDQPIENNATTPVVKIGQVGLSRVVPGRYLLTVTVTDPLSDKKTQTLSRSIDFTVAN